MLGAYLAGVEERKEKIDVYDGLRGQCESPQSSYAILGHSANLLVKATKPNDRRSTGKWDSPFVV